MTLCGLKLASNTVSSFLRVGVAGTAALMLSACSSTPLFERSQPPVEQGSAARSSPADREPTTSEGQSPESAGVLASTTDSTEVDAMMPTANTTRLTFAEEGADFDPCISRDGTWIVFASTQHRTTSDVYIKRTGARVMTQLTTDPADDSMPQFSPDGKRIAFASNRAGNWDLYVMPSAGGTAIRITTDDADELHPSWSPDGSSLVYSRHNTGSGRWELWTTAASNPQTAQFIGYGLFPQWCPSPGTGEGGADKILFQLARERGDRTFGIWTIDYANGVAGNPTQIASDPKFAMINPAWTPDGEWIVYAQADGTTASPGKSDLWMVSVQGTSPVRLTTDRALTFRPTIGPGNTLFFVSNRSGSDNIWSLDLSPAIASASALVGPDSRSARTDESEIAPMAEASESPE